MGKPEIELLGQIIHHLRWTGMGDNLLRNILVSSSPGEWGIFNHTLIKAAHLPHESVGGSDPPLFLPLPLPLSHPPCPGLVEVGGIASEDARAPDIASVGGTCCHARDGACLASRLRIVRADQTPGCGAAASPSRAHASSSSFLRLPLRARGAILRGLPFLLFLLSAGRSRVFPPLLTPAPLRLTLNCLDASPRTGRERFSEPSELAGA